MDISVAAFLKEQARSREKNGTEETEIEKIQREHAEGHTKFRSLQVSIHNNIKKNIKKRKKFGFCPHIDNFRQFFTNNLERKVRGKYYHNQFMSYCMLKSKELY